jgi:hypothetical protein
LTSSRTSTSYVTGRPVEEVVEAEFADDLARGGGLGRALETVREHQPDRDVLQLVLEFGDPPHGCLGIYLRHQPCAALPVRPDLDRVVGERAARLAMPSEVVDEARQRGAGLAGG